MPDFKISQGTGTERRDTTISVSVLQLKKLNQIRGHLAFYRGKSISSSDVIEELLTTWYESKRKVDLGGTN